MHFYTTFCIKFTYIFTKKKNLTVCKALLFEETLLQLKTLKKGPVEEEKTIDALVDEIKETSEKNETPEEKKFKNTDFISPVYGKMDEHLEYPKVNSFKQEEDISEYLEDFDKKISDYNLENYLEEFNSNLEIDTLEQTLDMEPISSEIKKNEEFLKALKEFRENL